MINVDMSNMKLSIYHNMNYWILKDVWCSHMNTQHDVWWIAWSEGRNLMLAQKWSILTFYRSTWSTHQLYLFSCLILFFVPEKKKQRKLWTLLSHFAPTLWKLLACYMKQCNCSMNFVKFSPGNTYFHCTLILMKIHYNRTWFMKVFIY